MHFIHFKLELCRTVDPEAICKHLFGERQHLCVQHKGKNENPHWHFQGDVEGGGKDMRVISAWLMQHIEKHTKYLTNPAARPLKICRKDVDEKGFQYMMKEQEPKVICSTFSSEELQAMHEASIEHVQELKDDLKDYLKKHVAKYIVQGHHDRVGEDDISYCKKQKVGYDNGKTVHRYAVDYSFEHRAFRVCGITYYQEREKFPPPNFQKLILWHMLNYDERYTEYVAERI